MAMPKKSTNELLALIAKERNISKFPKENTDEFEHTTLHEKLNRLLLKHCKSKAEIIRLSNLDKTYVYQILTEANPIPLAVSYWPSALPWAWIYTKSNSSSAWGILSSFTPGICGIASSRTRYQPQNGCMEFESNSF